MNAIGRHSWYITTFCTDQTPAKQPKKTIDEPEIQEDDIFFANIISKKGGAWFFK